MYLVHCWMEHPVLKLDTPFTYTSQQEVAPGMRVLVNFNGRKSIGFVETCEETSETLEEVQTRLGYKLKPIDSILDRQSLITPELHDCALWMAKETISPVIACFQAMLPSKIKPISGERKVVQEKWISCSNAEVSLTPKQLEAYTFVQKQGTIRYSELRKKYPSIAHTLLEKGAFVSEEKEKEASNPIFETSQGFSLTPDQQAVMNEIEQSTDDVYLLRGVTGAGKTEIYLQLAAKALAKGKQVLVLIPEIALTPQMIDRVKSRFGKDIAIYHSALNPQEKYEQYRMVYNGTARIVVGTRSAVFLPFSDLGLIVMDEEQDSSYKQENQPAYHCRDVAIYRGKYHGCKVLLGSATPSLESFARAKKGVYHLVSLPHRINDTLPSVTIVPLKECLKSGQSYILSNVLKEKIEQRLKKKEQIILLLNRRGYSNFLRCKNCQEVLLCPHCDLAMSYHHDEKMMKCHTCGTTMRVPKVCPSCGQAAGFSAYGYGTQKLQAELTEQFPEARLLRMDADTTSKKNSHAKILKAFENHEADILLGTQMIAKGLDYPDVTLVGVLNGDEGLMRTDYRSCEVTFDLLMQAGGRSGRANHAGEVVFQVYDPEHYAVTCAAKQDYETFFAKEMQFRHAGMYPPYTYFISLTVQGLNEKNVETAALFLKQHLSGSYKTLGVISLFKIYDRYRSRVLLKGQNLDEMRKDIQEVLQQPEAKNIQGLRIDVNPLVLD